MNSLQEILEAHPADVQAFRDGTKDFDINSSPLFAELYEYYCAAGEMPYGTMKARTGDPDQWIANRLEKELKL